MIREKFHLGALFFRAVGHRRAGWEGNGELPFL